MAIVAAFIVLLVAWLFNAWWLALAVVGCMAGFELFSSWLMDAKTREAARALKAERHQELKRIIKSVSGRQ